MHFNPRISVLLLSILASGCESISGSAENQKKLASDFHVINESGLHDDMRKMGIELRVLLDNHLDNDYPEPGRQRKTIASLDRIENIAKALVGNTKITNYSIINEFMAEFLYDV